MSKKKSALSGRLYGALLAAYPAEFRREYGREMALVFHARCREEGRRGAAALMRVWCETLLDIFKTAPREHAEKLPGGVLMRVLKTIVLAALAYAFALLVAAPLYMRYRESIPPFLGNLADALIATGIIFNFIFLILTLPRFVEGVRAVRVALVLSTLVVAGLIILMVVMGGPPAYPHFFVYVAQVLSLLIWFSIHMWWVLRRKSAAHPPAPA